MVTLLLSVEAALDGGSNAVHDLPRAADPLAHHEDHAPEGPHVASPLPGLVGARRWQPRAGWGLMVSGWRRQGGEGEMSQKRQWLWSRMERVGRQERKGRSIALGPTSMGRLVEC
jgi:hypothetical protein